MSKNERKDKKEELRVATIRGLEKGKIYWVQVTKRDVIENEIWSVAESLKKDFPECRFLVTTPDLDIIDCGKKVFGEDMSKRLVENILKRIRALEENKDLANRVIETVAEQTKIIEINQFEIKREIREIKKVVQDESGKQ